MHNLWAIGFRPFFLTGSLVSMGLILYWALVYFTGNLPGGYLDVITWHAHEMIYGFVISIVAGFLLTASANWTQTKPASGRKLLILFILWMAGRLAMLISLFEWPIPPVLFFIIDFLFIPMLAYTLAPPLLAARQLRNIQFIPVLSLLALGNLVIHLSALEVIDADYGSRGIYLGVNLILLIMVIIGGRIIPFFSHNALPGLKPKRIEWLEKAVIGSLWVYIFFDFTNYSTLTGWAALVAGILNFSRLTGWKSWKTIGNPLVWILHLGYFWIAAGFILIFLSEITDLLPRSVAIHAFTAGAMGTFIIGMMSRVSLGHTGRPLKLAKGMVVSYILITASGVVRVALGFFPDIYAHGILCAGLLWAISFLLFIFYYWKILTGPRADGRPG